MKKTFIIIGLGFIFILAGCQNSAKINTIEGISDELINTEKEAIEFAKKDADVISFAKKNVELGIVYSAYYNQELGVWQVMADAKKANDLDYQISFFPDGTITFKGDHPE